MITTDAELHAETTRETESVLDAQRLRRRLSTAAAAGRGENLLPYDIDRHDLHCAHVLVREGRHGRVLACARLLDASDAMSAGGFCCQQAFLITRALTLPGRQLEVSGVCVMPGRRRDAALAALWSTVAREAHARGVSRLIACASVPFDPEIESLEPLRRGLQPFWSSDGWRVHPRRPVPRDPAEPSRDAARPDLLSDYLRLGARIGGEPSWDPEGGVADFFLMIPVELARTSYQLTSKGGSPSDEVRA